MSTQYSPTRTLPDHNLLSYYYDAKATKPLPQDSSGSFSIEFFDAQENPPVAGQDTVTTDVYVRNDHKWPMELFPMTLDKDLTITQYPDFLEPGEMGLVRFAFSPSADRIRPFEGGCWDFTKIVYSSLPKDRLVER